MSLEAGLLNSQFVERLGTEEGRSKIAAYGSGIIRDHLREVSFARGVLPPLPISPAECQVSTEHDGLVKIEELEPESKAMVVDFRGSSQAQYVSAPRVAVSFFSIESRHYEKTEQELLAYKIPITKMIEDFTATDVQDVEDRQFLIFAEAGIQKVQKDANETYAAHGKFSAGNIGAVANGPDQKASVMKGSLCLTHGETWTVYPVQRNDFVNLFKLLSGLRKLRLEVMLMTEPDFDDILQWTLEDVGDRIQSETTIDGYKYSVVLGRKFVRTIKTDILRRGNIYGFTTPEFLGVFYILNNTKFYVDKVGNRITWWAWEDIGMALLNLNSMVKLELYAGSVTPDHTTDGYAAKIPSDEEDLGKNQNKAADGFVSPLVTQF